MTLLSFRHSRRLKQTELAAVMGLTQQAVSRLERDPRAVPPVEAIERACAAFDVEPEELGYKIEVRRVAIAA